MGGKKRILMVDDERELVQLVQVRLESMGYEVLAAHDGQEGLDKARKEKPDLILLDFMMPVMDGCTVCRTLKADNDCKNIPVIMLTARGQGKDKEICENAGANDYCSKPFESVDLMAKIKKLIGD